MSVAKLIHADNFFVPEEAERLLLISRSLQFTEKEYGLEVDQFNLTFPGLDPIFSKLVGEEVTVDEERSGIFRKPTNCLIHFEGFDTLNEWCFIIALERTTFNLYNHLEKFGVINARSALDEYRWNYQNLFEWDIYTNILLEPNQGVIFRPWLFHSIENGLVQYYRLVNKK
jgi:hypothetical protein